MQVKAINSRPALSSRLAIAVLAFAPALQWMTVLGSLVPGDLIVLPFTGIGLAVRDHHDWNQNRLRRDLRLPALLITLGSILALWDIGPTGWAMATMFQDLVVSMTFLGLLAYVRKRSFPSRYLTRWVTLALVFVAAVEVMSGGYRPVATLGQPNITGHFLVAGLVFVLPKLRRRWWWLVVPLVVVAVGRTGSFGALLSMPIAFAYLGFGAVRRRMRDASSVHVFTSWLLLLAPLAVLAVLAFGTISGNDGKGSGLGQGRLSASQSGRVTIWKEGIDAWRTDPMGLGPHGFKELRIDWRFGEKIAESSEIHNDYLGYLVERGPIGLMGLLLLYRALWVAGRKGGVARALLIANGVGGLTHESLHFRALWILVALALASELHDRPQREPRTRYARRRARLEAAQRAEATLDGMPAPHAVSRISVDV